MLVAEEVARAAGKILDFGEWEGDDQGKQWCRQMRDLIKQCDADADSWVEPEEPTSSPRLTPSVADVPEITTITHTEPQEPLPGYDSDDSITGYASGASSRSASPTPSELAEIEHDPSLRVGVKKVARPVYLAQLGDMVRSSAGLQRGNEQDTATKIEVVLEVAEELIRRKSGYGTELGMPLSS